MGKVSDALLLNRIKLETEKILWKNQNGFWRYQSTTSHILTLPRVIEGFRAKNLEATVLFIDFSEAFDSIHRGKMEQILLAHVLPKETYNSTIKMLYRNTKVKFRSPNGDTDFFDIAARVLQ